LTRKVFKT